MDHGLDKHISTIKQRRRENGEKRETALDKLRVLCYNTSLCSEFALRGRFDKRRRLCYNSRMCGGHLNN